MDYSRLIAKYGLLSDQIDSDELKHILELFDSVIRAGIPGDVVEFGCYAGTTSVYLQRLKPPDKSLHVYDSFQGLPPKTHKDESPLGLQFKTGELTTSKNALIRNFIKSNLPLPTIHKGWFNELTSEDIPQNICFAFLDGDYYESILTPLKLIWPKLSPGSVVVVDDYNNQALPGAAKAADEWIKNHQISKFYTNSSLGVMILPA